MKDNMKTLKITEETHRKLSQLKAGQGNKTLDETISYLINYFYFTPLKAVKEYHFDDKNLEDLKDGNK